MEDLVGIIVCIVLIAGGIWAYQYAQAKLQALLKKIQDAHDSYQASLKRLQREKTSDSRVAALEAGRYYLSVASSLSPSDQNQLKHLGWSVPMFTEVALQNDLQAYGAEVK